MYSTTSQRSRVYIWPLATYWSYQRSVVLPNHGKYKSFLTLTPSALFVRSVQRTFLILMAGLTVYYQLLHSVVWRRKRRSVLRWVLALPPMIVELARKDTLRYANQLVFSYQTGIMSTVRGCLCTSSEAFFLLNQMSMNEHHDQLHSIFISNAISYLQI